jgi:hypothetical protein
MFSITPIMTDGQVEEGPPHGLHARQTWILLYATPADNEEAHRIVDACQTIRNHPAIFQRMQLSMIRWPRRALNLMEDILSNCYKCTLSTITHN